MARFEKGNSYSANGNGSGRPKGSRNRLAQRVFDDIFRHWNEPAGGDLCKGQAALELLYREKPGDYLKLTASILPKEFVFENAVTELDDDELDRMIEMLRERALAVRQEQALEMAPEPKLLNGRH
jgi:hypothetical protein